MLEALAAGTWQEILTLATATQEFCEEFYEALYEARTIEGLYRVSYFDLAAAALNKYYVFGFALVMITCICIVYWMY